MIMAVALVGVVLLGCLAVLQLLLIGGAPLGRFAWGGQHAVLPAGLRIGSAVSIVVYGVVTVVLLHGGGAAGWLPGGLVGGALWVLTAYFVLGVAMNAASRSRPERQVMAPTALALAAVCLVLAVQ